MTQAFWAKFSLDPFLSTKETNKILRKHAAFFGRRNCSCDGSPAWPWTWVDLVHIGNNKEDVTEEDRQACIEYFKKHEKVSAYYVGPLVNWEDAEEEAIENITKSIIRHFTSDEFLD